MNKTSLCFFSSVFLCKIEAKTKQMIGKPLKSEEYRRDLVLEREKKKKEISNHTDSCRDQRESEEKGRMFDVQQLVRVAFEAKRAERKR